MSKAVKGKELFKMIIEGKIDKNTRVTVDNYNNCTLGFVFEDGRSLFKWLDEDFILIEDEIDIDDIEELSKRDTDYIRQDIYEVVKNNREATIELQKAVKQLNKEIKSMKEK